MRLSEVLSPNHGVDATGNSQPAYVSIGDSLSIHMSEC